MHALLDIRGRRREAGSRRESPRRLGEGLRLRRAGLGLVDWILSVPRAYDPAATPTQPGPTRTPFGRWFDTHPQVLRALAVLALGWQGAYLIWRVGFSWQGANPGAWVALLVAELYGFVSLINLTVFSWHPPGVTRPPLPERTMSVDVFVCTYDESVEVLRPTLVAAGHLAYPHTTYLLDDGRRPEMRQLAEELDAVWVTRPDNAHAKAGNINHALGVTDGELIFVLDADHVPMPDALDALVGYFVEESLALVQSPHDFYNQDSAQHYEVGRHEQSVFFEVVCPGKDHHRAAFWCGSATLLRRAALLDVGGTATETIAEDFHTTIKLLRRGWTTRYHDETLVQGLGPHDLDGYLLQRDRWARGNLSVLHTPESPLRARELTLMQRWSFGASLFGYGAGPARALLLSTLAVTLWTGALPLRSRLTVMALLWFPATILTVLAGSALCRGHMRAKESVHFELLTAEVYTRALRCLFAVSRTKFKVTPKAGSDLGGWPAVRRLPLVLGLAAALGGGVLVRGFAAVGVPGFAWMPPLPGWAAWLVPALAIIELRRVLRTLRSVARRRQLRSVFRFACAEPAMVTTGTNAWPDAVLRDAAPGGLGLDLPEPLDVGQRVFVYLSLPRLDGSTADVTALVTVRSCRPNGAGAWRIGTVVDGGPRVAPAELLRFCFVTCPTRRLRGTNPMGSIGNEARRGSRRGLVAGPALCPLWIDVRPGGLSARG